MKTADYIIRTEQLHKEYVITRGLYDFLPHPFEQKKALALADISIEIRKSEFVYILGLNGAGKTSLLKILSGMLLPTSGKIYFGDLEVKNTQQLKAKVGFANGEDRSFYWRLTAKENLEFFGAIYEITPQELKKKINRLFALFEIDNPNRKFFEYSSGFKQRFCIIRALLFDPEILLLDDPAKNLDYFAREKLLSFVKHGLAEEQKTVVISTSVPPDNIEPHDKLIILHRGKVKIQGNIEELKDSLKISDLNCKEIFQTLCG